MGRNTGQRITGAQRMTSLPPFVLSPQPQPGPASHPSLRGTCAECKGPAFPSSLSHVGHKVRPSEAWLAARIRREGEAPPKASGHSLQPCTPSRPRQVLTRRTPPSVYCSEGRPPCDLPPVSHSNAPQDNHLFTMAGGRVEGDGGWRIDKC